MTTKQKFIYIVSIQNVQPLSEVEKHVLAHRVFLDKGYEQGLLIASGPKNPRTGGFIIAATPNKDMLWHYLQQDPFYINKIADYEVTEFLPNKWNKEFGILLEKIAYERE